jgi:hypothetical protein
MGDDADADGETIYLANYKPYEFTLSEASTRRSATHESSVRVCSRLAAPPAAGALCARSAAHAPAPSHARHAGVPLL